MSDSVKFVTGSETTGQALLDYGIPAERVTYEPITTKYVAFGDSIAAGYALAKYNQYNGNTSLASDGDRFPTPEDAFVALTGDKLTKMYGSVVIDNQVVSGWTSEQVLTALQAGDFDAALKGADIVTVTIGSNDLLGPFMEIVGDAIRAEFGDQTAASSSDIVLSSAIPEITATKAGGATMRLPVRIKAKVEDFVTSLGNVTASLNDTLTKNETLNAACVAFSETTQPAILAELKEKALDAQIYWTTLYNPFYGARRDIKALFPGIEKLGLSEDVLNSLEPIELSDLGAVYIEKMNEVFEKNTEGYHAVSLYESFNEVGLTNVNITRDPGDEADLQDDTLHLGFDPHPNTQGHQLIYDILMLVINSTYTAAGFSQEYKINSISLKNSRGESLSSIPTGTFLATVSVTNVAADGGTLMALASYSATGRYKGLMWVSVEDLPEGATIKFTLTVDNSAGDIAWLKAFTLSSFENLEPFGEKSVFPAQN